MRCSFVHHILRLTLAIVLLPGLLTPVPADDCSCACCGLSVNRQHTVSLGNHFKQHGNVDGSGQTGCNQCMINPHKKTGNDRVCDIRRILY